MPRICCAIFLRVIPQGEQIGAVHILDILLAKRPAGPGMLKTTDTIFSNTLDVF
jgi:hypothetical protein